MNLYSKPPLFSIIVPVYNKAAYLAECLQSIDWQTCQDFELIIINDASTDHSLSVLKNTLKTFKNNQVTVFENAKNQGVSFSRNKGIALAKGAFIVFLDADDLWLDMHLQVLKTAIEKHPDYVFYATDYRSSVKRLATKDLKNKITTMGVAKAVAPVVISTPITSWAKMQHLVLTCGVALKKEVLTKDFLFRTSLKRFEDTDLWIRLALHYPLVYIPVKTWVYYTVVSQSLSQVIYKESYLAFLDFYTDLEKHNQALKRYLDQNRFAMLLELKGANEQLSEQIQHGLAMQHLNIFQKILLRCPANWLNFLKSVKSLFKTYGVEFKIYG